MDHHDDQLVEGAPESEVARPQVEEATPFFVRRLQKLPRIKTNIRAGSFCPVDDE